MAIDAKMGTADALALRVLIVREQKRVALSALDLHARPLGGRLIHRLKAAAAGSLHTHACVSAAPMALAEDADSYLHAEASLPLLPGGGAVGQACVRRAARGQAREVELRAVQVTQPTQPPLMRAGGYVGSAERTVL